MADVLDEAIAATEEQATPAPAVMVQEQPDTEPDPIADMKAQLEAANKARDEANARAAEAQAREAEARQQQQTAIHQRFGAQESAIAQALAAATNDIASLKAAVTRAQTEGNFDAATEAIDQLADAKIRLKQAEGQQRWINDAKGKFAQEAQQAEQTARQAPADPLAGMTPQARQWVNAHPRFLTDEGWRSKAIAAANYAEKVLGHAADSPEYYAHVETALGERPVADDGYQTEARPQTRQRTAAMAAAPSRSMSPSHAQTRQTFSLSPAEKEAALSTMGEMKKPDGSKFSQGEIFARYAQNRDRMNREKPLTPVA
jgi:hypothetical protein